MNFVAWIWNDLIRLWSKLCRQDHNYFWSKSMFNLNFPGLANKYANSSSNVVHSKHSSLFLQNINSLLKDYYKKPLKKINADKDILI